ncbi:hypothetical protein HNP99_003347 [Flavobacterium sp. 28A]|uniref:hypothetical protein n=1 Tax=Flavobacterium sp. 28A TaxID=2735895 RepID=UPI00156D8DED|nr:hypothetical protein [Flavobacterium sp. 28A]NRT16973.1 hypothetical protein [Flavobacterium sp. 28A]
MLIVTNAFEYAKNEFKKYHSPVDKNLEESFNFNRKLTTKQMIEGYKFELQKWAVEEFDGRKEAVKHFNSLGDTINEKTLNNWKNKDSVNPKT